MGNRIPVAQCSSEPNPAVPPSSPGPNQPAAPDPQTESGQGPPGRVPPPPPGLERNPGPYDELHKRCKDVFPICFDGAKVMINKGLSNHFQISHTLSLSPATNGYRFGVTYVGAKQLGPAESYPVFLGDTDIEGNVSATCIHHFTDRIRCKFATQIQQSKILVSQLTTEYRAPLSTSSLTVANPDLVNDSGILVGSFLRRLHPRWDLGLEMVYQYGRQIPGGQITVLSYAGRYNGDKCTASGSLGKSGLHLSYYHKQQENLQFGVEWETNLRMGESTATFGYQIELPKANVTFKGQIDSEWRVGATMEKKLLPLPFTFAISGMLNHVKAQSKFGIGLIVG